MKLLWVSDPPTVPSAYGQQTGLFVPRLRAAGYDVSILATSQGVAQRLSDGTLLLPVAGDRFGNSIVASHAKALGADIVVTLLDPHVLDVRVYGDLPWCAWAPLDFETSTRATFAALQRAKWIWSPSEHGAKAYRKAGLEKVAHVPHGVDSKVFDIMDRSEARAVFSGTVGQEISDDTFLVVAVAANRGTPSRKGFFEMLTAWKRFSDAHPDALLYVHTEPTGLGGIGEDLYHIMDLVDLSHERVIFPPQYHYLCGALGPEYLATVYGAADVFLSTSHGEGFGVPCVESQMCGRPVILPQNTAQIEMMKTGWGVTCIPYMPCDGLSLWGRPSVDGIVGALEDAHLDRQHHPDEPADAREQIIAYDADRIFQERMLPELARIEAEIRK